MKSYFVYFVQDTKTNFIKIGRTSDVKKRLQHLQIGNPNTLKLLGTILVKKENAKKLEEYLHNKFALNRYQGEWFKFTNYFLDFIKYVDGKEDYMALNFDKDWPNPKYDDLLHELCVLLRQDCEYGNYTVIEEIIDDLKNIIDRGHR